MSEEKSMNDYENELERSFQVLREGDILDVTVIGVSDTIIIQKALSRSKSAATIHPFLLKRI